MSIFKSIFTQGNKKLLVQLNVMSVIIVAICEIFVIFTFLNKGQNPDIAHWKYVAILIALVVISALFIVSIISLIAFFRMKEKG